MSQQAMRVEFEGLNELLRAMKGDISKEMRKRSREIAEPVAEEARFNALKSGMPMLQALAPAVGTKSDRIPTIRAGMSKKLTSSGAPANAFFRGAEFGNQGGYRQFGRAVGGGRSIYPAVMENQDLIADVWFAAVEEVFNG